MRMYFECIGHILCIQNSFGELNCPCSQSSVHFTLINAPNHGKFNLIRSSRCILYSTYSFEYSKIKSYRNWVHLLFHINLFKPISPPYLLLCRFLQSCGEFHLSVNLCLSVCAITFSRTFNKLEFNELSYGITNLPTHIYRHV